MEAYLAKTIRPNAVTHQAALISVLRKRVDGRNSLAHGQLKDLITIVIGKYEGCNDERTGPALAKRREGWLERKIAATFQENNVSAKRARRSKHNACLPLSILVSL